MDGNQKISSLDELRQSNQQRNQGEPIMLPACGLTLRVKRPPISVMIKNGTIPQNLVAVALKMQSGRVPDAVDELMKTIELMEVILEKCIVEPQGMTKEDIQALPDEDKGYIFRWIQGEVSQLEPFREQRTGEDAGHDLPQIPRDETKSNAGY